MNHLDDNDAPPEGFVRLTDRAAIESIAGPFYQRLVEGAPPQLGFRVTPSKLNKMGVCHGGLLALFADLQGGPVKRLLGLEMDSPTINLGVDFVAPAPAGAWVHSEPALVRRTGGLLFFEAKIFADGVLCARINGVYRLKPRGAGVNAPATAPSA
jgi:acyl-coenzyme A thioesterase PaaI-like protein